MGNIFNKNLKHIKLWQIRNNPNQPRKYFDSTALNELKESIEKCGVINPISVKKSGEFFEIVAGERRYRAATLAGLSEIPCNIVSSDDEQCAIIALVENIQRYDLDFIEEANGYKNLIEQFGFRQEEVALRVGKTQSSIANKLRVLKLDEQILYTIKQNNLTERHARALLKLPEITRKKALAFIIKHNFNVAKTDEYIDYLLAKPEKAGQKAKFAKVSKDVRLFINTINKSIKIMQDSGVKAVVEKQETVENTVYTIVIPNKA